MDFWNGHMRDIEWFALLQKDHDKNRETQGVMPWNS